MFVVGTIYPVSLLLAISDILFSPFFQLQSFWMDNQTKEQNKDFPPLDGNSVPLYDRGYALGLTSADGSSNVKGYIL